MTEQKDSLCMTYLDEFKRLIGHTNYYTIVSVTAPMESYKEVFEKKWWEFRHKFNIPDGLTMHFTNIKHLLKTSVPDDNPHNPDWVNVFKARDGSIDYGKMFRFYTELLDFIKTTPFIVQATGVRTDKDGDIRSISSGPLKNQIFMVPYVGFREHLNLMATYLMKLNSYNPAAKSHKMLSTKLRFDGDLGFGERDDLREAFHHSITIGTKHFRPYRTRKLFDEIRFIGKDEVGNSEEMCHAGNEVTDFIAANLARAIWNIETRLVPLRIPGHGTIDPLPAIKTKLFNFQKIHGNYFEKTL